MRRLLPLVVLLLLAPRADAQVAVAVQLDPEGDMLGIPPADLATRMQSAINEAYGTANIDGFIRSFADATAFSMRGLGVDYASDPNKPQRSGEAASIGAVAHRRRGREGQRCGERGCRGSPRARSRQPGEAASTNPASPNWQNCRFTLR